jgi:dihydroorotate dehydrogenase
MYTIFIRPLLFLIQPEIIHNIINGIIKITCRIPGFELLIKGIFNIKNDKLVRIFAGLEFRNPVGLAAGFDKNALMFNELSNFGFSFIEIGTITPKPQKGNKKPRSFRLIKDKALINRMGFNNIGVEKAVRRIKRKKRNIIIGGNIGRNSITPNENAARDYEICFEKLYNYVDYLVVNVSCPNIDNLTELQDSMALKRILSRLMKIRKDKEKYKPVLLKISPDLDNKELDEIINICEDMDINGIVATNTTVERKRLKTAKARIEKIGNGGLSGKPLKERSTQIIKYINKKTNGKIPVIGVGGIMSPEDAIEKIEAGATLVQLYTGFIYEGPSLAKRINKAILERYHS